MGREIFAPLDILAENVQIKVNFDSKYISEYRLIGYVYQGNIDGEEPDVAPTINVYSGDSITVCYEVKLVESVGLGNPELLSAELRYNNSLGGEEFVQGMSIRLGLFTDFPDEDMQFMASVIETVMILQKSEYIGKMTLTDVLGVLDELELDDHPERAEFRELIRKIIQAK